MTPDERIAAQIELGRRLEAAARRRSWTEAWAIVSESQRIGATSEHVHVAFELGRRYRLTVLASEVPEGFDPTRAEGWLGIVGQAQMWQSARLGVYEGQYVGQRSVGPAGDAVFGLIDRFRLADGTEMHIANIDVLAAEELPSA